MGTRLAARGETLRSGCEIRAVRGSSRTPAWVLLAKHDHQQRRDDQQAASSDEAATAVAKGNGAAVHCREDHEDGNGDEDPEEGRQTVEVAVGIVDVEVDRVPGTSRLHGSVLHPGRCPARSLRGSRHAPYW